MKARTTAADKQANRFFIVVIATFIALVLAMTYFFGLNVITAM